ncbi:hypothetical protein ES703_32268 [subsurface metagenome]
MKKCRDIILGMPLLFLTIMLSAQTAVIQPRVEANLFSGIGTYTGNVIDMSNITIDYTGSSGPAPIRIGTYGNPLANADEDQSGFLRLYGQTSANGSSYDRGIFTCLKTTGTKSIFPIAGLAEVLAQGGNGPTSVTAGQFIADLHTTDAVLAATTGGGEGMYGGWFKVTAKDGATTNANSVIAPIWVDNQLYGNNAATTTKEFGIRATTGGTLPKSFIGFETSSVGWDQLFYFDATAYDQAPVSNTSIKVLLNTTQYYLPLSTSNTSFTWGYPITLKNGATIDNIETDTLKLTETIVKVTGDIRAYQSDGGTSLYYHEHNVPAFSAAPGAAGATLTAPTANTLGGYQLDVNTEQLYFSMHVENDWDGKTDIIVEVAWEVNEETASDGTVDLQLICYYKGDHEATNKTQTVEVPHTITGNKAQFTQHRTTFIVNWDESSNVIEIEDVIGFILNLETDTSECDDIIINHMVSKYATTQPALETN